MNATSNVSGPNLAFRFEFTRPQGMQVVLVDMQGQTTNRFPIRPQLFTPGASKLDVRA